MWTMTKKLQALMLAAMMLLLTSFSAQAQDEHPAQVKVQGAITEMLDFLAKNIDAVRADTSLIVDKSEEIIVPHIDFVTMTRLSVGKNWRAADKAQQEQLVSEFKALLLNTYTTAMTEYSGEVIEYQPFRPENRDDRAVVRTAFQEKNGSEIPVVYKLRDKDGWRIYDIDVAGLSLVNNFRQKFTDEINSGGIDGLLDFLRQRNNR